MRRSAGPADPLANAATVLEAPHVSGLQAGDARWSSHGAEHLRRYGRAALLAPAREMVERGERLHRRVRATPPWARPDEEGFLPHLPDVLAGLFDSVEIAFASGPLRAYALRAEALAATVHISGAGRWFAADGTAEGSGLVSLAMWREDVCATAAVLVLRDLLERAGAAAPAGGGA
jgi:hypothetical protein